MKKKICLLFLVYSLPRLLSGVDVVVEELHTYDGTTIEYTNYTGPYEFINTADEIRAIGGSLDLLRRQDGRSGVIPGKYELRRIPPPSEGSSYGADILIFERGALIDHIDNIRRIITGYLMQAFGYATAEARTLAEAITLYNTYLRDRIDYVASRYSADVTSLLQGESLGLSRFYYEWAGSTNIIIPLATAADQPPVPTATVTPGTTPPTEARPAPPPADTVPPAVEERPADVAIAPAAPAPEETVSPPTPPAVPEAPATPPPPDTPAAPPAPPDTPAAPPAPPDTPADAVPPPATPPPPDTPAAPPAPPDTPADAVPPRVPEAELETAPEPPELRQAVEEIMTLPDELVDPKPQEVLPETRERAPAPISKRKLIYGIGGGLLFLLLLIALIVFLRRPKEPRSQKQPSLIRKSKDSNLPSHRIGGATENAVVMRLIFRDYLLNRKLHGDLQEGEIRSVGGKGAYFEIPYFHLPKKIAEVEKRGDVVVFSPVRPEYFPGLSGPIRGFYGKEIAVRASTGEQVVIMFQKYTSPLEEVNRIMRSIREREPSDKES